MTLLIPYNPFEDRDENESKIVMRKMLRKMIRRVESYRHKEVLTLRHIFKMKYSEIAKYTGKPLGTVKAEIHIGLKILKGFKLKNTQSHIGMYDEYRNNYLQSIFGKNFKNRIWDA